MYPYLQKAESKQTWLNSVEEFNACKKQSLTVTEQCEEALLAKCEIRMPFKIHKVFHRIILLA
jgi:hypothetical protein